MSSVEQVEAAVKKATQVHAVEAPPAAAKDALDALKKALAECRAHAATLAVGSPERAAAEAECAKLAKKLAALRAARAEGGLQDTTAVDTTAVDDAAASSGLYRPPGHNPPRPVVKDVTDEEALAMVKAGKRKMPEKDFPSTVHHSREAIKLRGAAKNTLEKEA